MDRPGWASGDVDLEHPSAARVYDYYLGGSHNFAVDRRVARRAIELWPELPLIMRSRLEIKGLLGGYAVVDRRG
ncbi:MAG: SAM-dependent methyltransferase [Pseudonocardiaceae bacterium]